MDLKVIILSLAFIAVTVAKRYCKINDDCMDLGELECIRSACDWGVCGCPHGQVSRFLGSRKLYRCVPLRKYDEKCSTDDDEGFCGAENSYCDEETGKCRCGPGYVPIWGGERCIEQDENSFVGAGETCSDDDHGLGSCNVESGMAEGVCSQHWNYIHSQARGVATPCACKNDEKLYLHRQDHFLNAEVNSFLSAIEPGCAQKLVGDLCLMNNDCSEMANAECVDNRCTCRSGYTSNYLGTLCILTSQVKSKGEECVIIEKLCDGSKGLDCGDICALDDNTGSGLSEKSTCVCGPFHIESGSSCVARKVGSDCYGDYNCRGISDIARCVDGKCEAK